MENLQIISLRVSMDQGLMEIKKYSTILNGLRDVG